MLICKDHKIYEVIDNYDYQTKTYTYDEVPIQSLIEFMMDHVEIIRNFTFGDLFEYIKAEATIIEKMFSSFMGHFPLEPYIEESKLPPKGKIAQKHEKGIHELQIQWTMNLYNDHLYVNPEFVGYGLSENYPNNNELINSKFSLAFEKVNELLPYPLILKKRVKLYQYKKNFKKQNLGKLNFRLFDILSAILYELTFSGLPQKRNEQLKQINKLMDEIKEEEKNDKLNTTLITYDELEKNIKEEEEKQKPELMAKSVELAEEYEKLLLKYKDLENIELKKFYMTNRANKYFRKKVKIINKKHEQHVPH